jgi:signal transduction histidine kinase
MLALWIYWYVSNYIIFTEAGEVLSSRLIESNTHLGALIGGIILLVAISVGMSLIFIYLTRQMSLTRFYDNFIANVTHELKTPLSSIQLYLETLKRHQIPESRQEEFVTQMLKDTERLNDLITSILDISGLEQRKLAYNFRMFDADDLLREVITGAVNEFNLSEHSLKIDGKLTGQLVVDKRALRIVLNNLIDNAIKYSVNPAEIIIHLAKGSKSYMISIADRGIGINRKDQNRIFKKFQRIYNPNSPNVKGTGLGLYWVREIIKIHGGKISASSPGPGAGTTFRIELPVYPASKKRLINRLLKLTRKRKNELDSENE